MLNFDGFGFESTSSSVPQSEDKEEKKIIIKGR